MQNKLGLELISWISIAIIVVAILLPIYTGIADKYPFYIFNAVAIVIFLYFTKHIFLFRHALFSHKKILKFFLVFACIPLFMYLMDGLYEGQRYFDEERLYEALRGLSGEQQISLSKYIRYELVFFTTSAIIVTVIFPIRLIVSEWRIRNRGTV